jgi:hypothetical protein
MIMLNGLITFLSVVGRFLFGDAVDFKIFSTFTLLAPQSYVQIAWVVETEMHLFLGK